MYAGYGFETRVCMLLMECYLRNIHRLLFWNACAYATDGILPQECTRATVLKRVCVCYWWNVISGIYVGYCFETCMRMLLVECYLRKVHGLLFCNACAYVSAHARTDRCVWNTLTVMELNPPAWLGIMPKIRPILQFHWLSIKSSLFWLVHQHEPH